MWVVRIHVVAAVSIAVDVITTGCSGRQRSSQIAMKMMVCADVIIDQATHMMTTGRSKHVAFVFLLQCYAICCLDDSITSFCYVASMLLDQGRIHQ